MAAGGTNCLKAIKNQQDGGVTHIKNEHENDPVHRLNKHTGQDNKHRWVRWIWPVTGVGALLWFLIRVAPKPSRAAYPCQRVAMPVAASFIIWITGIIGSAIAYRKAKKLLRQKRFVTAMIFLAAGIAAAVVTVNHIYQEPVVAGESVPNEPIGQGKGINPGRVVWVHDTNATDWAYEGVSETWNGMDTTAVGYWWEPNHTDQNAVDEMMSKSIRALAGEGTDAEAWDVIFRYFNVNQDKGDIGYQEGEKITIKVNMVTSHNVDSNGNQINQLGWVNTSPQMILALLRQLVYTAAADPCDITVGDTTQPFPNHYWNHCHSEFPEVRYLAHTADWGRRGAESSEGKWCQSRMYWSTAEAEGKIPDYLPVSFAEADYIINFACFKGHLAGVTICAKNHYGSFIRRPDADYDPDYYNMHLGLPCALGPPGMGHNRNFVDIMGHWQLGAKTVLHLIDGLYGGYNWQGRPYRWKMVPFGDGINDANDDWPSSLFVSQDAVAIDSVAYDFLLEEWPHIVAKASLEGGAEDYLHEAAEANDPCSGTFYDPDNDGNVVRLESLGVHEHWNNAIDKQYSRNIDPDSSTGIELVRLDATAADLWCDGKVEWRDFAVLAKSWRSQNGDNNYNRHCDISEPSDGVIDEYDLTVFMSSWLVGIK